MCTKVEEVLSNEITECTVTMDGVKTTSSDFVTVLAKDNGDAGIYYNTDAVTLGMAVRMISKAFVDAMHELSDEDQACVTAVLNGEDPANE